MLARECLLWWSHFNDTVSKVCAGGIPVLVGIDGNYSAFADASSGVGNATHGMCAPPQHQVVCDFINTHRFTICDSFNDLLGYNYQSGVPTYVPKKGTVFDA